MKVNDFLESVKLDSPPTGLSAPLTSLWWDAKGDWAQAHGLVDELETNDGMAVHAYLHRKEGRARKCRLLVRPGGSQLPSPDPPGRVEGPRRRAASQLATCQLSNPIIRVRAVQDCPLNSLNVPYNSRYAFVA